LEDVPTDRQKVHPPELLLPAVTRDEEEKEQMRKARDRMLRDRHGYSQEAAEGDAY
jgi:hypothetical protein